VILLLLTADTAEIARVIPAV